MEVKSWGAIHLLMISSYLQNILKWIR